MRTLLRVTLDTEAGTRAITDGSLATTIGLRDPCYRGAVPSSVWAPISR